jgi:hypothetical protein
LAGLNGKKYCEVIIASILSRAILSYPNGRTKISEMFWWLYLYFNQLNIDGRFLLEGLLHSSFNGDV